MAEPREDVDELLAKHAQDIELLRAELVDVIGGVSEYDDIFLLRFVLTHKDRGGLGAQADAVRKTVKFRTDNREALAEVVRTGKPPNHDVFIKFQAAGYVGDLGGLEPVHVIRGGHCNAKGLMHTLSHEQVVDWLLYLKEIYFNMCDERTRKTRKMVKSITIMDMDNYSIFDGEPRFFKALGESSKLSAVYYPQLLGKTVILNAPSYMRALMSTVSVFLPKSTLNKIAFCPASKAALYTRKDAKDIKCPFIQKMAGDVGCTNLPDFLGGRGETPENLKPRLMSGHVKINVGSRSCKEINLDVPVAGLHALWEVTVEDFGIDMSAQLLPSDGSEALQLMAVQKIRAENGLTSGDWILPTRGQLQVRFDNSYSLLRSKNIEYRISVSPSQT
mmetsp:Transcript_30333/g.68574  ORF Transcript_30333/g.68574 Transcript_30333/m.68574 type:complete len:389 (-) Transcript_30333:143-1309(-)